MWGVAQIKDIDRYYLLLKYTRKKFKQGSYMYCLGDEHGTNIKEVF